MPEADEDFLGALRNRARERARTLVFPEGEEPRIQAAVAEGVRDGLFVPLLIGSADAVRAGLADQGLDAGSVDVRDPSDPDLIDPTERLLRALRKAKGASTDGVEGLARDPLYQAGTLVAGGDVHGAVAGAVRKTADVVRAALSTVGVAGDRRTISSAFYMVFPPDHPAGGRVLTFTDAGVLPEPDADQLAELALAASDAHRSVVGEAPRVAFLSYATKGSAEGRTVTLARDALTRFRTIAPDVEADGELQGDAALVPDVAGRKAPGSDVAGRANVLVFPDLASANIAYKLVEHLGGAHALGPVLHGLARPFNDLSRGAAPHDIASVACVTALMAN